MIELPDVLSNTLSNMQIALMLWNTFLWCERGSHSNFISPTITMSASWEIYKGRLDRALCKGLSSVLLFIESKCVIFYRKKKKL